jgi:hypothetical protein
MGSSIIRVTRIGELLMLAITSNQCTLQFFAEANAVPSSPILVTLMMEALCSSKTLVLMTATWRNIPEDGILHSHHCENLNSYTISVMCIATADIAAGRQILSALLLLFIKEAKRQHFL